MEMDGSNSLMDTSDTVISSLDNIALLAGLPAGSLGIVSSAGDSTLTFNIASLPVLASMAKDHASSQDLALTAQSTLENLIRVSDVGAFSLHSVDGLKLDPLTKQMFEEKGLSPLNILGSSSVYHDPGGSSPAPALQFRSAGNGGDTMLSAINYTDNEMLADSAFEINNSGAPGLGQLDDNLFGLSNPSSSLQGQTGNTFDLFDSAVNDPLSPFGDSGLPMDTSSLPMDGERSTDGVLEDTKPVIKSSPSKKQQQQNPFLSSPNQTDQGSPGKCNIPCQTCGKQFNSVSTLAKHRLTHSDERKFLCTICNKGFKRQDHLNGHQMTHLDKKPFGCPLDKCDKGYCDARSLRRHLEAHHHLPQDMAQSHVAASMAASGISPPAQRNGKSKLAELAATARVAQGAVTSQSAAASEIHVGSSPTYSSSASTPSPGHGSGNSQNPFFHFETSASKIPTTVGSLTVKMEPEVGEMGLRKLQKAGIQQQHQQQQQSQPHGTMMKVRGSGPPTPVEQPQQPPQFQVQFQLQHATADLLGQHTTTDLLVQHAKADLLAVMQAQQLQLQFQQQQQQQSEGKTPSSKKSKLAKEAKMKAQELVSTAGDGVSMDSGVSSQSDISWHERAQVYNFVGTPGSADDESPVSVTGDLSPGSAPPQASPAPSPMTPTTPSSPMPGAQRLNWPSGLLDTSPGSKKKDKDDKGEGPVQCSVCDKRFKTLPALNGHMRLHGGYLKKEEGKRSSRGKSSSTSSPTSTSSSPTTPTDMGPPPPPSRPSLPAALSAQHSPVLPPLHQQMPLSPSLHVPMVAASAAQLLSHHGVPALGDLQGEVQTFYLADAQTLDMLQQHQQHQMLHQQLQLQQMAQKLKEKEEEDIRSLEEQLKQNIHEQQLSSSLPPTPTTPQPPPAPLLLAQVVNHTLPGVMQAISPLPARVQSPLTQEQEKIQQLVERFQQVEELHRQQQQLQPLSQVTAQQIQQLQQQHSLLGLPPLQPLQLQQMLQEQQQQQLLVQQQLQQQHAQSVGGLHLASGQLLIQSASAGLGHGPSSSAHSFLASLGMSPQALASTLGSMTPGLPGGVLSGGQQLQVGNRGVVVSTSSGGSVQATSNPVLTSASLLTSSHFSSLLASSSSPSASSVSQLLGLPPNVSEASALSISEHLGIQDPSLSQLMGGLENVMDSELLPQPHSAGFGVDMEEGDMLVDQGASFHHNPFASTEISTYSVAPSLNSIKEDVMLSSTVQSVPHNSGEGHNSSDRFQREAEMVSMSSETRNANPEIRRCLSGDMDLSRKTSSSGSLTISSLLNQGSSLLTRMDDSAGALGSIFGSNPNNPQSPRVRMRSKSGDVHKLMRSKSVDHSLMRQRSNTEESIYRARKRSGDETFIGRSKSHGEDYLSHSDGAGVFRNPGCIPSPLKIKRKNRPSPLFIPPTLTSFQSRLRSPRLWDGGDGKGGKGHTPPPYTPPPMLSPIRSGSGLFCSMQGARPLTPQSAPVSARPVLNRRGSLMSDVFSDSTAKEGDEELVPPETDIKPHVNIGPQYQADLPPFNPIRREALYCIEKSDLMWEPLVMIYNTDEEVQSYQEFACCAAVKGNGANVEYALHLLYLAKGDLQKAMLMLMGDPPVLPAGHTLLTYKYQESDSWSASEIQMFHEGLIEFDKDFFNVARKIGTKSVKECIQFYYLWKKVCPDDYKRLRILRRKRNHSSLYNLRSQPEAAGPESTQLGQDEVSVGAGEEEGYEEEAETDCEEHAVHNGLVIDLGDHSMDIDMSSVTSSPANPPSLPPAGYDPHPLTLAAQSSSWAGGGPASSLLGQQSTSPAANTMTTNMSVTQKVVPTPAPAFPCDFPGCGAVLNSKQSLVRHSRKHTKEREGPRHHAPPHRPKPRPATPSRSPVYDNNGEEIFPCKICDRVFTKVKSRSAHMKSHKVPEPDKSKLPAACTSPASSAGYHGNPTLSPISDI